ncbi:RHS repeat protein, partial [Listeria monocytogenes]|uniref:RHS repeat protein n=1 Tax=Listeria monocytogenes TaxID=1639 RepID=UPI000A76B958
KYTYDSNDDVKTATSKDGTSKFTYNKFGDVLSAKDATGETLKYEYDTIGRKTALIYPDNTRVSYRYSDANLLTDVIESDGK